MGRGVIGDGRLGRWAVNLSTRSVYRFGGTLLELRSICRPTSSTTGRWTDGEDGADRRKLVQRATWITVKVPMKDVPESIRGVDLWDAVEKWEEAEAGWLREWDQIGAQACASCEGRGWVRS